MEKSKELEEIEARIRATQQDLQMKLGEMKANCRLLHEVLGLERPPRMGFDGVLEEENKMLRDAMVYGTAMMRVEADGTRTHIPMGHFARGGTMTKEDILSLPKMTVAEQIEWLVNNGVIAKFHYLQHVESLADCAFRLRDEYKDELMANISHLRSVFISEIGRDKISGYIIEWFAFEAKPIHWICVALLAKNAE